MAKRQFKFQGKLLNVVLNSDADKSVFYEVFEARDYQVLDQIIKTAKYPILDLGAHIGLFSIYASVLNPSVKIFAFEPEEENFSLLKENLKLNEIANVVVKNLAVAAIEGPCKLYLSEDSHNHSLVKIAGGKEKVVQAIMLEKIFEKNKLQRVSLVKLDTEGSEFKILENLQQGFFGKVDCFYVEYHKYTDEMQPEIIVKIFQKNGFKTKVEQSRYDRRFGFIFAKR